MKHFTAHQRLFPRKRASGLLSCWCMMGLCVGAAAFLSGRLLGVLATCCELNCSKVAEGSWNNTVRLAFLLVPFTFQVHIFSVCCSTVLFYTGLQLITHSINTEMMATVESPPKPIESTEPYIRFKQFAPFTLVFSVQSFFSVISPWGQIKLYSILFLYIWSLW